MLAHLVEIQQAVRFFFCEKFFPVILDPIVSIKVFPAASEA